MLLDKSCLTQVCFKTLPNVWYSFRDKTLGEVVQKITLKLLKENWTLLVVNLWKKVWYEIVTAAVVLINAGLVGVNSNFCREFCTREMKQKFHSTKLNLFSCQSTVKLSFKTKMTKVNAQISLCCIMVMEKVFQWPHIFGDTKSTAKRIRSVRKQQKPCDRQYLLALYCVVHNTWFGTYKHHCNMISFGKT